jgi:hypothetical protein
MIAAGCFFALVLSQFNFPDPDLFHEMALAREVVRLGHVPRHDLFAYTPTVTPVVHHEWGTGVLLFAVTRAFGASGLIAVRYVLALATFALAGWEARRRGGSWPGIALVAFLAALPLSNGFATVRAQDFTLFFTCLLLYVLEWERDGKRRWVYIWFPAYIIWLNVHGGFVAGVALFAVYVVEEWIRQRGKIGVLLIVMLGMFLCTLINPYGIEYPKYILHATTMPRPQITEWAAIWHAGPPTIAAFVAITVLFLYCVLRNGWNGSQGSLMLAAALAIATLHLRHASLAALVALCYLPEWLRVTPLGRAADNLCDRRPALVLVAGSAVLLLCIGLTLRNAPWQLPIPANGQDFARQEPVVYPAGATDYLNRNHIAANVMAPFTVGGFVSWKCYPPVKVSIDGRYEVAYEPLLLTEINDCYAGEPGWRKTLDRYPTDLVLVPHPSRLTALLADQNKWTCVYRDDAYSLWARPGLSLPVLDRIGSHIVASIP